MLFFLLLQEKAAGWWQGPCSLKELQGGFAAAPCRYWFPETFHGRLSGTDGPEKQRRQLEIEKGQRNKAFQLWAPNNNDSLAPAPLWLTGEEKWPPQTYRGPGGGEAPPVHIWGAIPGASQHPTGRVGSPSPVKGLIKSPEGGLLQLWPVSMNFLPKPLLCIIWTLWTLPCLCLYCLWCVPLISDLSTWLLTFYDSVTSFNLFCFITVTSDPLVWPLTCALPADLPCAW